MVAQLTRLSKGAAIEPGFTLTQFLGSGGLGEVWRAEPGCGRPVALKFLRCGSQQAASREIRALQSIRQVRHPNLIQIHQIWADSDYVVVCMDLAEGSLLDLLDVYYQELGGAIGPQHLCQYLEQAAAAIDFLNARQHLISGRRVAVRHCDVKPSNLLVKGKTVLLADFSLTVQATSPLWYAERVGTLNYAAPEVFQGRLSDRTDQYALAVSYYQLRTGRLPFADTPATFDPKYVRPAPELEGLSTGEGEILTRALDPVPQARWNSCCEMIALLKRVASER